jgi:hypothetical protein
MAGLSQMLEGTGRPSSVVCCFIQTTWLEGNGERTAPYLSSSQGDRLTSTFSPGFLNDARDLIIEDNSIT